MSLLSWLWHGAGTALPSREGVGFAGGYSTATAVGRALGIVSGVGAAAGTLTATATFQTVTPGVGAATGGATVSGYGLGGAVGLTAVDIEFTTGGGGFAPTAYNPAAFGGFAWTSVISDTRSDAPIILDYGVQGSGPTDRVASTGTLSFTLNNAADNSAETEGYYSPLHAMRRTGHDLNVRVRLVLTLNGQRYYKFLGRLAEMAPEPGRHGTFGVPCTAVDLMDDWAANDLPIVLPIRRDLAAWEVIAHVFNALATHAPDLAPHAQALEAGSDLLPFAFHDPTRRKIREILMDATMSDLGFAAIIGTTEGGGLFTFLNRHAVTTYPIRASLINQFAVENGFHATLSRDDIASSVEVFGYPADEDTTDVELFRLAGTGLLLRPLSETVIRLPFKNPDRQDTVAAALSLVPLEPTGPTGEADYTANTLQDGSGDNLSGAVIAEHVYPAGGTEAVVRVRNVSAAYVFLTLLKGRGKGLYLSEASAKVDLDTPYGRRPLQIVMPLQGNVNTLADIAHFFSNIYKNSYGQVEGVRFCAQKSQELLEAAVWLEPGHLIYLEESVSGILGTYRIQSVHLEIQHRILWCTWRLAYVLREKYWILGEVDSSELGLSTILGF